MTDQRNLSALKLRNEALYDAGEYLIAGLENQAEWWEHLGDAHRDYAALARAAGALQAALAACRKERDEVYAVNAANNYDRAIETRHLRADLRRADVTQQNSTARLSPRPWKLIWDEQGVKDFVTGEPRPGRAPITRSFRIVDAENRLLVRIAADPEQTLNVEDMQAIVEAVNAL